MTDNTTCPTCNKKGHSVDSATVKSMLAVSLRHVQGIPYRFCATPDCEVVYYSDNGNSAFTTHQVRERVYQKEAEADDVLICYCFQHTPADIRQQFGQSNHQMIIDDINTGIQAGQCACDWRNPQGNCCLGNVRQYVKKLEMQRDERAGV